jgi:hypothetical protein
VEFCDESRPSARHHLPAKVTAFIDMLVLHSAEQQKPINPYAWIDLGMGKICPRGLSVSCCNLEKSSMAGQSCQPAQKKTVIFLKALTKSVQQ